MTSFEAEAESKLIVALDIPDAGRARAFWQRLDLPNAVCKIGLELLFAGGVDLARTLASDGVRVFIDAKLYDIGHTVERATARVADLGAAFLTVHAQDAQTVEAAARGREGSALKLLGVTLLTSVRPDDLPGQGIELPAQDLILRRAAFAVDAGFDGIVASPREARSIKSAFGDTLTLVCPGIRLRSGEAVAGDDQARTATPGHALRAGADFIVIGRPILRASDPVAAAREVIADMAGTRSEMRRPRQG
jgi:orotidine-5'-phosphate decarboxylase